MKREEKSESFDQNYGWAGNWPELQFRPTY